MERVTICLTMVISIEENTNTENLMVMEFIHGQMAQAMKEYLMKALKTGKDIGEKELQDLLSQLMSIKVIIKKIRNADMENSNGQVGTRIKVPIKMMSVMGKEKWPGQMDQCTLVIGSEESSMATER